MKKFSLAVAAFGLTMFVACGDDSSSNASSSKGPAKDAAGHTVYTDMQSALTAPCSEANKCEIIILNDPIAQDTLQCNGTAFMSMMGTPLAGCETPATAESSSAATPAAAGSSSDAAPAAAESSSAAAPAAVESSSAVAPATAESSSAATPAAAGSSSDAAPAAVESSSATAPAAGSSASADVPAAGSLSGAMVSCDLIIEGVMGEHSCKEISASDAKVESFKANCTTAGSMDGMTATVGTACPASSTLKCPSATANVYSYDAANASADCAKFTAGSMAAAL